MGFLHESNSRCLAGAACYVAPEPSQGYLVWSFEAKLHRGTFLLRNNIDAPGGERWVVRPAGGMGRQRRVVLTVVKILSEAVTQVPPRRRCSPQLATPLSL
jgi:hypothetical protein